MAKYSRDLDDALVAKVKNLSAQYGLQEAGIRVEAIRLTKGKTYGEVKQANELTQLFTGEDNIVAVALYEEVMEQFDDVAQDMLIKNLLEQILVQEDKEGGYKVKIEKPQLNVGVGTYQFYGKEIMDVLETVILTLDQMAEQEKAAKEAAKEAKKQNKKNKKGNY